jgi:hypothetical protein
MRRYFRVESPARVEKVVEYDDGTELAEVWCLAVSERRAHLIASALNTRVASDE